MRLKAWLTFITVAILLVIFPSCGQEYGILEYQNGNIFAVCEVNGEYTVNIIKEGNARRLEVVSPSEMAGVSFVFDEKCRIIYDGLELEMQRSELLGISTLCSIFDLNEGMISAVSDDEYNTVSFNSDTICYTVTYNSVSLPERVVISGDFEYDIIIKSISLDK